MRGEVLYFDAERGIGFANGDDGNRYHFDRADLPGGYAPRKGVRIAFTPSGNRAGAILPEGGFTAPPTPPARAPDAPPMAPAGPSGAMRETRPTGAVPSVAAGRIATAPSLARGADASPDVLSLFGYFKACATGGYARFRGRARRKEYWGFVLFFYLGSMLFGAVGGVLDGVMGNIGDEEPIFLIALPVLFGLAMIVPSIALTVRRIHDIGLSGWFFLLALIPTVGGLIILVFMLVPSQKHANRWGEVPPGVL